jgi:hypothetical protein
MKLFIASGGVTHRFTKKKLQIATPEQDKLRVWLLKKASHSDPVELYRRKTWFQPGYGLLIHMPVTRQKNIGYRRRTR